MITLFFVLIKQFARLWPRTFLAMVVVGLISLWGMQRAQALEETGQHPRL